MRLSQRPVCGIQTGDRSWTTVTIRQFKVMAAKRHNNQVTGLPSLVGTYLSVGGLWRVTASLFVWSGPRIFLNFMPLAPEDTKASNGECERRSAEPLNAVRLQHKTECLRARSIAAAVHPDCTAPALGRNHIALFAEQPQSGIDNIGVKKCSAPTLDLGQSRLNPSCRAVWPM